MTESIPSSAQPAQAVQKPRFWVPVSRGLTASTVTSCFTIQSGQQEVRIGKKNVLIPVRWKNPPTSRRRVRSGVPSPRRTRDQLLHAPVVHIGDIPLVFGGTGHAMRPTELSE